MSFCTTRVNLILFTPIKLYVLPLTNFHETRNSEQYYLQIYTEFYANRKLNMEGANRIHSRPYKKRILICFSRNSRLSIHVHFVVYSCKQLYQNRNKNIEKTGKILLTSLSKGRLLIHQFSRNS
jgi:hypothetical protein